MAPLCLRVTPFPRAAVIRAGVLFALLFPVIKHNYFRHTVFRFTASIFPILFVLHFSRYMLFQFPIKSFISLPTGRNIGLNQLSQLAEEQQILAVSLNIRTSVWLVFKNWGGYRGLAKKRKYPVTKGVLCSACQTFWILKTVGFQKQNLEVQKNVNFKILIVLEKNWFHWTKSADEFICQVRIGTSQSV